MVSVVAHTSNMHSLVPLRRHHSRSSCPHPMLKSLKLGELGIERDPFVLPSDWRSEVLRSSVRSMVDMQRSSVLTHVDRLQISSAGVHGELALLLSGGRSRECFLLSILLENPADISSASDHLVRVGGSARAARRPAIFAMSETRSVQLISASVL